MTYGELFLYLVILFANAGQGVQDRTVHNLDGAWPASTSQSPPFVPSSPYGQDAPSGMFWYGNDQLWTLLGGNGTWTEHSPKGCDGYCTKLIYWARRFDA